VVVERRSPDLARLRVEDDSRVLLVRRAEVDERSRLELRLADVLRSLLPDRLLADDVPRRLDERSSERALERLDDVDRSDLLDDSRRRVVLPSRSLRDLLLRAELPSRDERVLSRDERALSREPRLLLLVERLPSRDDERDDSEDLPERRVEDRSSRSDVSRRERSLPRRAVELSSRSGAHVGVLDDVFLRPVVVREPRARVLLARRGVSAVQVRDPPTSVRRLLTRARAVVKRSPTASRQRARVRPVTSLQRCRAARSSRSSLAKAASRSARVSARMAAGARRGRDTATEATRTGAAAEAPSSLAEPSPSSRATPSRSR